MPEKRGAPKIASLGWILNAFNTLVGRNICVKRDRLGVSLNGTYFISLKDCEVMVFSNFILSTMIGGVYWYGFRGTKFTIIYFRES